MENEVVTISLTVAEWNQILGAISTAPFQVVNSISSAVAGLQSQAGPQMEELFKKHAPAEEAAASAE
jgi:hypothetical protein